MRRFHFNPRTVIADSPDDMRRTLRITPIVEESPTGEYVLWDDVEKAMDFLQNQIPEFRIAKLEKALGLVSEGKCPECGQATRGYKPTFGALAPEIWATMRESGLDPVTGHRVGCTIGGKFK